MRKIIILILVFVCSMLSTSNPSSENYILQQESFSSGNVPSTSANFILQCSAVGEISGNESTSENYNNLPGYYLGEITGGILPPENVMISVVSDVIQLSWEAVNGATSYRVYSSDNPYSAFTEDLTGTFNGTSWSTSVMNEKIFYYVTTVN